MSTGVPFGDLIDRERLGDYDDALERKMAETYAEKADVPTRTSELVNDSGFMSVYTVGDLPDALPQS